MKLIEMINRQPVRIGFGQRGFGGTPSSGSTGAPNDFDSRAHVAATAISDPTVLQLRTAGYSTPGDGGGALYIRAGSEPTHAGKVQSADGAWWELSPGATGAAPEQFGATTDLAGDDAPAMQDWFDYLVAKQAPGRARGRYRLDGTVTLSDPHNVHLDATGAHFQTPNDILMFDLNGRADPTYTDNESRQNFAWIGGKFSCTFANPTKATAFRLMGMRHARLEPEDFGITGGQNGFYRDIITGGKDTIYIGNYKTFDVERASIEVPPWSILGGPLLITIEKVHASLGGGGKLIKTYLPLTDSVIRDVSCNLGTGAAHDGAIDVSRSLCIGVPSVSGTFQAGETVTGGTSGATAVFVERYDHDFPFQVSQHTTWLVLESRFGTFVAGEALIGGTSGASATVPSEAGYRAQNFNWQNFRIEGSVHFEAGSGAGGAIGILLRNRERTGNGTLYHHIDAGGCGINGGGAVGVQLEAMGNVVIKGRFAQTSGLGTPIRLDPNCYNIKIARPTHFSTGPIDLNGMSRDELDLGDWATVFSKHVAVTGWTPKALSTTATSPGGLIDMSQSFTNFTTVGGLAPRAYVFDINARDTGSRSAWSAGDPQNPQFRLRQPGDTAVDAYAVVGLADVPDQVWRSGQFLLAADDAGDVKYDCLATGAGTLTVELRVTEMRY